MAAATEPRVPMLDRLERETRAHHATAEAELFRVLDDVRPEAFRRFLAATYHFEYAVEARLVRVDDLPLKFLAPRLRSGRLGDDLLALGDDPTIVDVLARPLDVPMFCTAQDALGWLYVLERDTLHHAAIHQALAPRLHDARLAARYLTARAADAHARWRELADMLDRFAACPDRAGRIVAAACAGFAARHRWFAAVVEPRTVEVTLR